MRLIPISGKCWTPRPPKAVAMHSFRDNVLRPAFQGSTHDRVILVDHSRSGDSIDDLAYMMKQLRLVDTKPLYINLAYADSHRYGVLHESHLTLLKRLVVGQTDEDFRRFDLGKFGRILPFYPREIWETHWRDVPNADAEVGAAIVRMIQADNARP